MHIFQNFDLLAVLISIIFFGILGFSVYFNNRSSVTNRSFLYFSLTTVCWSILNYLSYQFTSPALILWILRFSIFSAVWHAFFIFNFIYVFPNDKIEFGIKYKRTLIPFISIVSVLTLTPLVFKEIAEVSFSGGALKVVNGPGIIIFGITILSLVVGAVVLLIKKTFQSKNNTQKNQGEFILTGIIITFLLLIIFNFILPAFLNNPDFIPLGGLFTIPFIGFTTYAILRRGLFNVKVIATEILVFVLWIFILIQAFLMENRIQFLELLALLLLMVIFGIMLIKSVNKEVKQREKTQILAGQLESLNKRLKKLDEEKSEFLSIASHQLRTPMTVIKGYISMIMEGSFGDFTPKLKEVLNRIYISNERLVNIVDDLLDISRIERGKMNFSFKKQSLGKIIKDVIYELKPLADQKKLKIIWEAENKNFQEISIDENYMRQVILNLIDNAIKYSNEGSIEVNLEEKEGGLRFSVKDSGIGIPKTVMPFLFQRYSRGEKAYVKMAEGMGLGLYVARKIVEGHRGKVWAKSEGEGCGSIFFVELPVVEAK